MATKVKSTTVPFPCEVHVDTREQYPYTFQGIQVPGKAGKTWDVTIRRLAMKTGDYSIPTGRPIIVIERKSLEDLYNTLGQNRKRFENEFFRCAEIVAAGGFAEVVIESSLSRVLYDPPEASRLHPSSVRGTLNSWSLRHGVHVTYACTRRLAEEHTLDRLYKFSKEHGSA